MSVSGSHFEVISPYRPFKFCPNDQCAISGCTFAELAEQNTPFSARLFEVLGPHSDTKFNPQILTFIALFLGEIQDNFVALVIDKSNNSALYDLAALRAFYESKNWEIFTNPMNRQNCRSITIFGIQTISGVVSRYLTFSTSENFSLYGTMYPDIGIITLIHFAPVNSEKEILNWIEMEIRTRGWCNDLELNELVVRFNKNPSVFLENLENIFDRLVCPIGFAKLGYFYHHTETPLLNRQKAICCYKKALRLMPNEPDPERSRLLAFDDSDVYENLAEAYFEEGYHLDALQSLETAMRWGPTRRTEDRLFLLARIYKDLGDFGQAELHLFAVLKCEGTQLDLTLPSNVYIELADISAICGRFPLAHEYLNLALKEAEESYGWQMSLRDKIEKVSKELALSEKLAMDN